MPTMRTDLSRMTTHEKLDLIRQIEASIVPNAPDVDEKRDRIEEISRTINPGEFTISDAMMAELDRRHEEYLRDPSQAISWEEAKAEILREHGETQDSTNGAA
jgi:putative addiction module component (TIGR02574 family)